MKTPVGDHAGFHKIQQNLQALYPDLWLDHT